MEPGPDAKPPLEVSEAHRLRYESGILEALDALARAANIGRALGLAGETGGAKTTVAGHFAEITGRQFLPYQTHAASEAADLTIDVDQSEDGLFRKRVKDVYRALRQGNVVIDIDAANVSPRILWAL